MESEKPTEATESDVELVEDVQDVLAELNIDEVIKERDEFKDIALRVQADFENYRKRAAVQLTDEVDRSTGRIVEAMLPVLDACEAAVAHGVEGVENIWSSLLGTLQKSGLEALDLQGQPFDPALAEAVLHEEGDGGEAVVVKYCVPVTAGKVACFVPQWSR